MKKYLILLISFLFIFSKPVNASDVKRFVNIVNPVRGSNLWQSVDSVRKQINLIEEYNIASTWLLQYDVMKDENNSTLFENLSSNQELGVLLEVSENMATDANVAYLYGDGDWARADKVLLSGFTPLERKRMIDLVFKKFKEKFGMYPKSVGAWYIDTISLDYLVKKYHVGAVMNVADQYDTDSYGLWGQPWSTPYYPSYLNSLIPARDEFTKLGVIQIQWAQRDPNRGYGLTVKDSVYSVQANDYIGRKLDTDYFKKLAQIYLFSPNPITQLTVGLEAGQEGATYLDEYKRQLEFLLGVEREKKISFSTMSSFAQIFNLQYPERLPSYFITGSDYADSSIETFWYSSSSYRVGLIKKDGNLIIRDLRVYKNPFIFFDIYEKDPNHTLKRIIPAKVDSSIDKKEQILITNVDKIQIERKAENVSLLVEDKKGSKHQILLTENAVISDKEKLYEEYKGNKQIDYFVDFIAKLIVTYWVNYPDLWIGDWRYSSINNKYYFGYMVAPTKLVGLKSESPFIGIFYFPFQTLIRFKTFPKINITEFVSADLVNMLNHSTIKAIQ